MLMRGQSRHTPDDISVFDVWHISTVDMYFDISARILAYQWTFGISARILAYHQGGLPTFGISETTMGSGAV